MHAKNQREEERVKCLCARATVSGTRTAVAGGGGLQYCLLRLLCGCHNANTYSASLSSARTFPSLHRLSSVFGIC